MNLEEGANANNLHTRSVAASVSAPMGIPSLDSSSYAIGSNLSMNVGFDTIGGTSIGGGYGQPQHASSLPMFQSRFRDPLKNLIARFENTDMTEEDLEICIMHFLYDYLN